MWATTTAFETALSAPARRWRSKVEVLYGGQYVVSLEVLVDGKVSFDDVAVRRSADLDLLDVHGTLTPVEATDLLSPKGTELRLSKGLVVAGGAVEWVPLGVFGIDEPQVRSHDGATQVSLSATDRVNAVRARRFKAPYPIASGTATTAAIVAIVTSRLTVSTRVVTTGHTTPEIVYEELSDPWDAVEDLAEADSLIAYFDPLGTFVVEPRQPSDTGRRYSDDGEGHLVTCRRGISADQTYSGVIVKGEHPDFDPVRYEIWDENPASATYRLGPFGERPYGFTSPLIKDLAMAQASAQTILTRVTGMVQPAEIETAGHPGHDIGDVVVLDDEASRTHGDYEVIGGTIPLRPGTNTLKLRRI
jgi:hypothetical protein